MEKAFLFMSASFILSGCAVSYNPTPPSKEFVDYPEINQKTTARVGEQMVAKGVRYTGEALNLRSPVDGFWYKIMPGSYIKLGYVDDEEFFDPIGIRKSALADEFQLMSVKKDSPYQVCVVTVMASRTCYDADFEIKEVEFEQGASFQQTLLYSGKVGDKIRLGYREFSDGTARPAFSNDVEYDLSESNRVGYKGAELEVIEADNRSITYRVLQTFEDIK